MSMIDLSEQRAKEALLFMMMDYDQIAKGIKLCLPPKKDEEIEAAKSVSEHNDRVWAKRQAKLEARRKRRSL